MGIQKMNIVFAFRREVCVSTRIALPLNLGFYRRQLSTDEFIQSMTAAVGSLGSVEKAKLDQYKSMVAEKFSHFDLDGSGGIRCYHPSVRSLLAAVVASSLYQLHGPPCPAHATPCTSHPAFSEYKVKEEEHRSA